MADTKTQRAIDFIKNKGSARSKEIAEHIKTTSGAICSLLKGAVQSGELVTCRVETPGSPPQTEYRAGAGGKPQAFRDFRVSHKAPVRPPTKEPATPIPPQTDAAAEKKPVTEIRVPLQRQRQPVPEADRQLPARIGARAATFGITEHGEIGINLGSGPAVQLTRADVAALSHFLETTSALWSPQ